MATTTPELSRLLEAIKALRDGLGAGATVDRMIALLTITHHTQANGSIDQNELATLLGIEPSTMARNVAAMSDIGDRGREALNIIEVRFDPNDRRRRLLMTNTAGKALVNKALSKLGGKG